tara:strand:+ start:130 stop:246 length:117 start_codon:yes stop_codon:yes gene_type:complete
LTQQAASVAKINHKAQQETYHADALIPLYEMANITIST